MHHLSATEAVRQFSDVLNRVKYRGECFAIERGGEVVAQIVPSGTSLCPIKDFVMLLHHAPAPDADFANDLESIHNNQPLVSGNDPWEQ